MSFNPPIHPAWFAVLAAAVLGWMLFLVLRSTQVRHRGVRTLIVLLRGSAVGLVLFILADPVQRRSGRPLQERNHTVMLVDTSESMALESPETRLQQVADVVASLEDHVPAGRKLSLLCFDEHLHSAERATFSMPREAVGEATNLSRSLIRLLQTTQDLGIAEVVVFSDGRIHDTERLGEAVLLAKRRGVPVHTFTAGSRQTPFNLTLRNCMVARHAPPETLIPVRVLLHAQGAAGRQVLIRLKKRDGSTLAEASVTPTEGLNEQTLMLDVGTRSDEYSLELVPVEGELTFLDNVFDFKVEVVDPRIRVLYMEGSNHPDRRWGKQQYEFLQEAFLETGNIEVDVLTVDEQLEVGGRLFRVQQPERGYPSSREELFQYDVVICSDINRSIFTAEQIQWTVELVAERGGGFCMIGGYTAFGAGGWDKTEWEQMIPMDMQAREGGYVWDDFTPEFPPEALRHAILQLDADPENNERILGKHPIFKGTNLVNRAKPGAEVLAIHPQRKMPVISVQAYGKGRSMAFTSDAAGGWGEVYQTEWGEGNRDNRHYRRFWVNSVRWLAENSMARRRTKLVGNTEAVTYRPGEDVKLRAQVLPVAGQDWQEPITVTACLDADTSERVQLRYDRLDGAFRGTLTLPDDIRRLEIPVFFSATDADGRIVGEDQVPIRIVHVRKEFADVNPDQDLMARLARTTGGRCVTSAAEIRELLVGGTDPASHADTRQYVVPLWDRAWLWAVVVLLLSSEWLIRKLLRFG